LNTKEAYFTIETIRAKAKQMLAPLAELRVRHQDQSLQPERAALLVLDVQEYFLDPKSHAFIPSAPAILPGLAALVRLFSEFRRPVYFTRHINSPLNAGQMSIWWRDLIASGSSLSHITPVLDSSRGTTLIKTQYDAFYQTDLEGRLRTDNVEQLVICGLMTHLCCETTARSAFVRGFAVYFAVDGTATYHESFHCAALLNLAHGFAQPVLVAEVQESFHTYED
jgi:isochorismate hydrolase